MGILPIGDYSLMLHTSFSAESLYILSKQWDIPASGLVTFLNYKVVSRMSIITERHNHMAAIKRSVILKNVQNYFVF